MSNNDVTTVGNVRVEWDWENVITISIYQVLRANNAQWTIRYPEVAPEGSRYEYIVEDAPTLTMNQEAQVQVEKGKLQTRYTEEMELLHKLLKLWSTPWRGEFMLRDDGSTAIEYDHTVDVEGAPYDIRISVYAMHKGPHAPQWKVYASVGIVDDESYIHLHSIDLPITDGVADSTPLIEYLQDNPLYRGGRALSKIARYMKKSS
jgi:hypothetical protein